MGGDSGFGLIRRWLDRASEPTLPEPTRRRLFIWSLSLTVLAALAAGAGLLLGHPGEWSLQLVPGSILAILFLAWLVQLKSLRAGWMFFLWGGMVTLLAGSAIQSGNRSAGFVVIPIFVMLSSWVLGRRQAIAMTLATIVGLGFVAWAESAGLTQPSGLSPAFRFFIQSSILLIGMVAVLEVTLQYQRHVDQQLRLGREHQLVVDNAPVLIAAFDTGNRYRYANARYARFFGREPGEIAGRHLREVIGEAGYAATLPWLERMRAGNRPVRYRRSMGISTGGAEQIAEVELVPQYVDAETGIPTDGDGGGDYIGFVALLRDVSEEVRAEEKLRRSEQKFATIFRASPVASTISDVNSGLLIDVNAAFEKVFGWPREAVLGKRSTDIHLWRSQEDRARWLGEISGAAERDNYEVVMLTSDGQARHILISSRLIDLDGATRLICLMVDISDRMAAEAEVRHLNESLERQVGERTAELQTTLAELKQSQGELLRTEKMAALGKLVAGVAHELNTPLGNAVTIGSTLQEQTDALKAPVDRGDSLRRSALLGYFGQTSEGLSILMRNLERAHELISRFKQVAVDQTSEQRRRFSLDQLVSDVAVSLSPSLRAGRIVLAIDVAPGIDCDSYPGALGQVLINLIQNADTHAYQGQGGTIRVEGAALAESGFFLLVTDYGGGIDATSLGRVFEPFFSTRFGQGGSGLGLSIVHGLATQVLGGRISVDSTPGAGTTFRLELPLRAPSGGVDAA